MKKSPVLFISAGLKQPKKEGNPFAQFHSYLNYGLLGLASILYRKGYNSKLYHGHFSKPNNFSDFVIKHSNFNPDYPIFISLPSVFAIEWAKEFIEDFKNQFPETKIIIGGRWVVENDGIWIRNALPNVDLVVYGTAERRIEGLLDPNNWASLSSTDISPLQISESQITEYPSYEYELMHDFRNFHPSIEVSRGCGLGCSFCLEKDSPLQKIKSTEQIFEEVRSTQLIYRNNLITPYFESSFFRPTTIWAKQLAHDYVNKDHKFKWRSETRIDSLSEEILNSLAIAGLKILDIGLESASISQLTLMNKSHKPKVYLERASKFLKICKALDIWAKVNILLYAGETVETINETIAWLENHKDCIKGVSVNPLVVYGRGKNTQLYLDELKEYGAEPVDKDFFLKGYTMMNLSKNLSFHASEEYRIQISKKFMTHNDYFDLKSFSYLSPDMTKTEFDKICLTSDTSKLPFDFKK